MPLNLSVPSDEKTHLKPRITVVGVGGAGGNAVNNMITSKLEGVEFVVANTDAQALEHSQCERRIQLCRHITSGLGAGSRPDVGRAAAEEAMDDILEHLEGSNMVFITAGMGGGTGTGAAPVIARAAREQGILTVGVVTKPFQFEGIHRMRMASNGLEELQQFVDTLIIIPNQNLFRVCDERTTFADAFKMADDVLHAGVRGVTDLMVMPGLINLDFADIRTVMSEMGKAMMGTGEAESDGRAVAAAEAAISNPLLDDVSMRGARGVLINITGGMDMTLFEVDEAANRIREEVDPEANIIFGSTFDESMNGLMRVSIVATGIDVEEGERPQPLTQPVRTAAIASAKAAEELRLTAASAAPEEEVEELEVAEIEETPVEDIPVEETPEELPVAAELEEADESGFDEREEFDQAVAAFEARQNGAREATGGSQAGPELSGEPRRAVPRMDDAFIPPEPVESPRRPVMEQAAKPEPFAEAAMTNGGGAGKGPKEAPIAKRSRSATLFGLMTGAAKAIHNAEKKVEKTVTGVSEDAKAPQASVTRREPQIERRTQRSEPVAETPKPARQEEPAQQSLSGVETKERKAESDMDEDLFEIPTFLRRQAN
ncbi:MAG: cell division protein FtsZ [Limibacillus sp.]